MGINSPSSNSNEPEKPGVKKKPEVVTFRTSREAKKEPESSLNVFMDYLRDNTKDSIAYVVMVVGILLMLFDSYALYGSLLVGIIFSLYFINEISFLVMNIKDFVEEYGLVKSLVLGGALLALFIKVPFFFIGIAAVVAIKLFVWPDDKKL